MIVSDGEDDRGLDRALTAGLVAGGRQGLQRTYLAYADRLFEYCRGLVPDPDAAADALHDAFVVASQRAVELVEPDRLRAWLYALVRNECLRLLADRNRDLVEPPEPDTEQWSPVRDAVDRLPRGNRVAYELAARHGLADHDIAEVLGISEPQVQTRLTRADAELARELPPGPDGSTEDLLAGYREARFAAAPAVLWPRVELNCFDPGLAPERTAVVRRAGRFDPETGFPEPLDVRRRRRALVTGVVGAAAAVVGLLVLGAGAVAWLDQPAAPPAQAGPGGSPSAPGPATPTGSAPPEVSPSPTGTSAPSPSIPPGEPVPPPPQSSRPPAGSSPVEIAADAERDCVVGGLFGYTLQATATASQPLTAAALVVVTDGGTEEFPMDVERESASVESEVLTDREAQWFVEVTTVDDEAAATQPAAVPESCA
jgi:RNA polymerase sigma factor (sigma-70 family)